MLCGLVWNKNEFAYRCNTCALNSGMALCIKCFENGNHDNTNNKINRLKKINESEEK